MSVSLCSFVSSLILSPFSFFSMSTVSLLVFPYGPSLCRLARQSKERHFLCCSPLLSVLAWLFINIFRTIFVFVFFHFFVQAFSIWHAFFHHFPFSVLLKCLEWFVWFLISHSSARLAVSSRTFCLLGMYFSILCTVRPPAYNCRKGLTICFDRRLPLTSCWDCNRFGGSSQYHNI